MKVTNVYIFDDIIFIKILLHMKGELSKKESWRSFHTAGREHTHVIQGF